MHETELYFHDEQSNDIKHYHIFSIAETFAVLSSNLDRILKDLYKIYKRISKFNLF